MGFILKTSLLCVLFQVFADVKTLLDKEGEFLQMFTTFRANSGLQKYSSLWILWFFLTAFKSEI